MDNVSMCFLEFLEVMLSVKGSIKENEIGELKVLFEKCKTLITEGNRRIEKSKTEHDIAWEAFKLDCENREKAERCAWNTSSDKEKQREGERLSGDALHNSRMKNDIDYWRAHTNPSSIWYAYRYKEIKDKLEKITDEYVIGMIKENYTGQYFEPNFSDFSLNLVNKTINSFKGEADKVYHNLLCKNDQETSK